MNGKKKKLSNQFHYHGGAGLGKPINAQCPFNGTLANSVDPDQTPQNAASDLASTL